MEKSMEKIKSKKHLLALSIIIVLLSIILITKALLNQKIDIQKSNENWENYDLSIENIKNNMDPITEPNESFFWWKLKDFNIEDKEYEQILNSIVANVRMCYLSFTDNGELYTNSNPIKRYRDKKFITKDELEKLNFDMYHTMNSCLERFEQYNETILISKDEYSRNKLLNRVNKINTFKNNKLFINTNDTYNYNDLLLRKTIEVHLIEDLSDFIVEEYNRLKIS